MRTWTSPRGQVDLAAISGLFAPDMGPFFVRTTAVSVENTHNFAGGAVLPLADLEALRSWSGSVGVAVHLDGARLWNAHVATGTPLATYGAQVDVLTVCFSKGLGAPVGSMLVGSEAAVTEARVWRKRLGGGMRQVGILAAGAAYALDHHVDRLAEDHAHARLLAEACGVDPVRRRHEHRGARPAGRSGVRRRPRARRGCWSRRSGRGRCGWSPTSTSAPREARRAAEVLARL